MCVSPQLESLVPPAAAAEEVVVRPTTTTRRTLSLIIRLLLRRTTTTSPLPPPPSGEPGQSLAGSVPSLDTPKTSTSSIAQGSCWVMVNSGILTLPSTNLTAIVSPSKGSIRARYYYFLRFRDFFFKWDFFLGILFPAKTQRDLIQFIFQYIVSL